MAQRKKGSEARRWSGSAWNIRHSLASFCIPSRLSLYAVLHEFIRKKLEPNRLRGSITFNLQILERACSSIIYWAVNWQWFIHQITFFVWFSTALFALCDSPFNRTTFSVHAVRLFGYKDLRSNALFGSVRNSSHRWSIRLLLNRSNWISFFFFFLETRLTRTCGDSRSIRLVFSTKRAKLEKLYRTSAHSVIGSRGCVKLPFPGRHAHTRTRHTPLASAFSLNTGELFNCSTRECDKFSTIWSESSS